MRAAHLVLATVLMGASVSAVAGTAVDERELTLTVRGPADPATLREGGGAADGAGSSGRDCSTTGGADAPRECGTDGGVSRDGGSADHPGARHHLSWQSLLPGSIQ